MVVAAQTTKAKKDTALAGKCRGESAADLYGSRYQCENGQLRCTLVFSRATAKLELKGPR